MNVLVELAPEYTRYGVAVQTIADPYALLSKLSADTRGDVLAHAVAARVSASSPLD